VVEHNGWQADEQWLTVVEHDGWQADEQWLTVVEQLLVRR